MVEGDSSPASPPPLPDAAPEDVAERDDGAGAPALARDLLATVVEVAVGVLRPVTGASVSVLSGQPTGFETASATSTLVKSVDEVQYGPGGGPCVQAILSGSEVRASLPAAEWPAFSAAAEQASVRAVWSLPLEVGATVAGALNLYATVNAPWEDPSARVAAVLARQSALLLANGAALAASEQVNVTLRRALETRTVIGQAQGVLMARQGIDADEAFDILRRASQRTNRKLRDVAAEVVASAVQGSRRS